MDRVRGVPGVRWAVRLFRGQPRAKAEDGRFRVVILMGLDDASLAGAPARDKMLLGSVESLRDPDAIQFCSRDFQIGAPSTSFHHREVCLSFLEARPRRIAV